MRILFVQENPGTRICRLARCLVEAGDECGMLSRTGPRVWKNLYSVYPWSNEAELAQYLITHGGEWDIWHIHLGNSLHINVHVAMYASKHHPNVRLALDCRDIPSMIPAIEIQMERGVPIQRIPLIETEAFRNCDGAVHVSESCRKWAELIHGSKPSVIVHNRVHSSELPNGMSRRMPGTIVYSGGIETKDSQCFRNLHAVFESICNAGHDMHVQSAISQFSPKPNPRRTDIIQAQYSEQYVCEQYEDIGCQWHSRVPDINIVQELSQYTFGFVGFPGIFPLGQAAMPNKLFEYLAAGVVPLVHNCQEAEQWVVQHGLGFPFNPPWGLPCSEEIAKAQQNIASKKQLYVQDVCELRKFYKKLHPRFRQNICTPPFPDVCQAFL